MRIGLTGIFVDDQDQAEQFYTQVLGLQVTTSAPYGPEERWLSVVSPEEPDGVQLVLHLADEPARAFQQASPRRGRVLAAGRDHRPLGAHASHPGHPGRPGLVAAALAGLAAALAGLAATPDHRATSRAGSAGAGTSTRNRGGIAFQVATPIFSVGSRYT
jgi:catechol 2,3-dioxygenase-like lactoylglutathione lyase family enzyme